MKGEKAGGGKGGVLVSTGGENRPERESMATDAKQERKKKSTHKRLKAQARGKSHLECRSKQEITSERGQVCQRMQLHEREAKQIHKNRQASE